MCLNVENKVVVDEEVMDRAENMIQDAMARLENEFRCVLILNIVSLDAGYVYSSVRSVSAVLRLFVLNDGEIEEEEVLNDIVSQLFGGISNQDEKVRTWKFVRGNLLLDYFGGLLLVLMKFTSGIRADDFTSGIKADDFTSGIKVDEK